MGYHAQIAHEKGLFNFEDVARTVTAKMMRRHPHVFGDLEVSDDAELMPRWEADKARTRKEKGQNSVFDGMARNLPALRRAHKLQSRAARNGFDWKESADVLVKVDEELAEVREAIGEGNGLASEIGDLLFTIVNLSRHFSIAAEDALRKSNLKFERRFSRVEEKLKAQGRGLHDANLEELDDLWEEVKAEESA